jgi:hypothetical protein
MSQSDEPRALPPEGKGAPRSIAQRPPDAYGRPRFASSAHETGRLRPRIASATSNAVATVEPASRNGCAEATTPGAGDATIVRRIGAPRLNHQVRESSAGPYDGRCSRPGSDPRLPSPSTQGRQGRSCGSRITGWHASLEGRTMTTSSSATSPSSSPMLPGHGWSICLLRRSPTRTTWSRPSRETSMVRTYILGTHGIFESAASSQGNPCESTSGGFPSSAPSCPTSPTRTSSGHSSPAPRAGLGEQTGAQDSHQGERIDGHCHQVRLWLGGGRSHLPEGQEALGKTEGRRLRGIRPAWLKKESQEEGASKARRR